MLTLWYKWEDTKRLFRERGWEGERWRVCLFASEAKQKWKSQQCREPEWGSKILCWQNYWPQYCTQILEGRKKNKLTSLLLERQNAQGYTCSCTQMYYRLTGNVIQAHTYTGLRWTVTATQLNVYTHARSLSHTQTHTQTPRPGIGYLPTLFSPKRSLLSLLHVPHIWQVLAEKNRLFCFASTAKTL